MSRPRLLSLNREILRLAIPNIISNLSVPLLSSVDTALMGRLSDTHIGAVGIGSMIFNFIYWNFGFLRMGTTGITAQYFGAGNRQQIIMTLGRAMLVAAVLAALMLLLQWPLREAGLFFMQASDLTAPHIAEYFDIRIWAAPASLMLYVLMGWFFGMQDAIFPLVITVAVNVANIVISLILVGSYGMEIAGVAWGTVAAQYLGLLVALGLFMVRYKGYLKDYTHRLLVNVAELGRFMRINRDIFLRTLSLTLAFGFFYSQSSNFGPELLAVNVILLQYLNWMSYGIDGFAFATESIVGRYYGAGDEPMVHKSIRYNFLWAGAVAGLVALAYGIGGIELMRLFTNQEDVILAARPYLFWMILFPLAGFACYIWDGVYIGLTASVAMRNSMALALVVFVACYFLSVGPLSNHGLWLSLLVFLVARGLIQWAWFRWKGLKIT